MARRFRVQHLRSLPNASPKSSGGESSSVNRGVLVPVVLMASLAKNKKKRKRCGVGFLLPLNIFDLQRHKVRQLKVKNIPAWKIYFTHIRFESSFLPYFYTRFFSTTLRAFSVSYSALNKS